MGKQQLVDDLDAVVSYPEGRHHLGRDGWRTWGGRLDGGHTGMLRGRVSATERAGLRRLRFIIVRPPTSFLVASAHVSDAESRDLLPRVRVPLDSRSNS